MTCIFVTYLDVKILFFFRTLKLIEGIPQIPQVDWSECITALNHRFIDYIYMNMTSSVFSKQRISKEIH